MEETMSVPVLCVGTAGMSVWFSRDLGQTWDRPYSESGLYLEARVWALSTHPDTPGELLAGTDSGLYRWRESERRWTHLPGPLDSTCTWSLARRADDPDVIVAGTHPAALWRSDDAGLTWRRLAADLATECIFVHRPRVTQVIFDPDQRDTLWAGVEIDAIHHSSDGGAHWNRRDQGLVSGDIHGVAVVRSPQGRVLLATTNKGLHQSLDEGRTWQLRTLDSPWQYTRSIQARADGDGTLFLTNGNGPPGSTGRLLRSTDFGKTWQDVGLPGTINSTPWCVASQASCPQTVFTVTNLGQLFRSTDGGAQWIKLEREFGEVRAMALI
jgi:photosystem II stability/assembly factor-like uncharacterized protein